MQYFVCESDTYIQPSISNFRIPQFHYVFVTKLISKEKNISGTNLISEITNQQNCSTFDISCIPQTLRPYPGADLEENKENVCFPQNLTSLSTTSQSADTEVTEVTEVTDLAKVEEEVGGQEGGGQEVGGETEAGRVLHPELKQILGQSHLDHAISLPLITALCNDTSLVHTSRSHSGSRSSYDTSTIRSTESRLTRLSHDTDRTTDPHPSHMP